MKVIKASEPVFGSTATLFVECTEAELREHLLEVGYYEHAQALKDDPRKGIASTITAKDENGNSRTIVWLPPYSTDLGEVTNLMHECIHVASDICGEYGIAFAPGEPNEAFAYLAEYYYEQFLKQHGTFAYLNDKSATS